MNPPPANLHTPRLLALRDASPGYGFLPWADGPLWALAEIHRFQVVLPCGQVLDYEIPDGYQFNKASTPPCLWGPPLYFFPDGLCTLGALEHDFLCDLIDGGSAWLRERLPVEMLCPPPVAVVHAHFEFRLLQAGMWPIKARAWGVSVKLFGPGTRLRRFLQRLNPFRS